MGSFFKNLFGGAVQQVGGLLLGWAIGLPIVGTAMSLAAGLWVAPEIPIPYLIAASSITFAALMTAVLRFSELRARHAISGLLTLDRIAIAFDLTGPKEERKIKAAQVQLFLENRAQYPISYIVEKLNSSLMARINPSAGSPGAGETIPSKAVYLFRDHLIDMGSLPVGETLEGKTTFRIRYGKPGREKYILEAQYDLAVPYSVESGGYPITTKRNATGAK